MKWSCTKYVCFYRKQVLFEGGRSRFHVEWLEYMPVLHGENYQ